MSYMAYPNFIFDEMPQGSFDSVNKVFTLIGAPSPPTSLQLYLNGSLLSAGTDYSLSGNTITMYYPTGVGNTLYAYYQLAGPGTAMVNYWSDGEVPTGITNGVNRIFTIKNVPSPLGSLMVFRNGSLMQQGIDYDFDQNVTVTFLYNVDVGSILQAFYQVPGNCLTAPGFSGQEEAGGYYLDYVHSVLPEMGKGSPYFTLVNPPNSPKSLQLYVNGLLQQQGVDYVLNGQLITFLVRVPYHNDIITAYYRYYVYNACVCIPLPPSPNTYAETPGGLVNSQNSVFSLTYIPAPLSSLYVAIDQVQQQLNQDYIYYNGQIQFLVPPRRGGAVTASYYRAPFTQRSQSLVKDSLITYIRKYLNDPNAVLWSDSVIERFINEAEVDATDNINTIWQRFSLNIIANQNTYSLPDNLKSITRMTWMSYAVNMLSQQEISLLSPTYMTQQSSQPRWATMQFEGYHTLRLYPGPSTSLPILSDQNTIYTDANLLNEFVVSAYMYSEEYVPFIEIPDYFARKTVRFYVMWKAYAQEGIGQNLKLSDYYGAKYVRQIQLDQEAIGMLNAGKKRQLTDIAIQRPWKRARPILPPTFGTYVDMGNL